MKILVTGANGQLGRDLMNVITAGGDDAIGIDIDTVDITSREAVHDVFAGERPDAVINCAAFTAVDACESNAETAMLVNGTAVRWVAEASDAIGAHLVHISTDYVFDGTKIGPYVETDVPNPQSVYGRTKLVGEQEAMALESGVAVVRTSWVCGLYGNNMVKTVHKLTISTSHQNPHNVSLFTDRHEPSGAPTMLDCRDTTPQFQQVNLQRCDSMSSRERSTCRCALNTGDHVLSDQRRE